MVSLGIHSPEPVCGLLTFLLSLLAFRIGTGLATDLPKMAATYAGPLWEAGYRFTPNSRLLLKGIEWMKIPLASWPPWRLLLRLRPQGPRLLDILDPGALCLYYCGISKKII
ncbi:uncharacterized protein LOC143217180 isoform X1 [Lasioglossum baleicum]|uniref:uncharacterized protein LOC143217180 isoform X1 n=1 Tax=Lasioglossum baleicum TaxID=434251 RepID=UPI003FCC2DD3